MFETDPAKAFSSFNPARTAAAYVRRVLTVGLTGLGLLTLVQMGVSEWRSYAIRQELEVVAADARRAAADANAAAGTAYEAAGETRSLTDTLRHANQRVDTRIDSSIDRIVSAVEGVREAVRHSSRQTSPEPVAIPAPRTQAAPPSACGVRQTLVRDGYAARTDGCTLTVTIPRGGSISGASKAYFGDFFRWQQDRLLGANASVRDPDWVEPGQTYTFRLR